MSKQRGGLGRGLGSLIPTAPTGDPASPTQNGGATTETIDLVTAGGRELAPVVGATFREVPIAAILPNPRQPRTDFAQDALDELVASIREVGVLQPIVVRATGPGQFELVMGERRLRACTALGMAVVPAIVRETADDAMLRDALLENLHRQQLNPLEEAAAYQQLLTEFGATHEQLAARLGRSRPQITNTIRLLNLPARVQRRVAAGVLSAGHARALLSLSDPEQQELLASRVVAEGLSVRTLEELVTTGARQRELRAARVKQPLHPAMAELAALLGDRLETRVKIEVGRGKGRLIVEFSGPEDLARVAGVLIGSPDPNVSP